MQGIFSIISKSDLLLGLLGYCGFPPGVNGSL